MTKEEIDLAVQAELNWVRDFSQVVAQVYLKLQPFRTIQEFINNNWWEPKYQTILRQPNPDIVMEYWADKEHNIRNIPPSNGNSVWREIFDYDWDTDDDEHDTIAILNALQEDPDLRSLAMLSPEDYRVIEGGVYSDAKVIVVDIEKAEERVISEVQEAEIQAYYKNLERANAWVLLTQQLQGDIDHGDDGTDAGLQNFMDSLNAAHEWMPLNAIIHGLQDEVHNLLIKYRQTIILTAYQDLGLDKTENKP